MNKIRPIIVLLLILFIFNNIYGNIDNDSTDSKKINFGLGLDKLGYYLEVKDITREYYYTLSISPYFGYFITNKFETGLKIEPRIQRSNLPIQSDLNGFGGGYYLRYNFLQFDPIRTVFKRFPFRSCFIIEFEHLITNYGYKNQNEINHTIMLPRFMNRYGSFNQHHYVPKIGLKTGIYRKLFFILNLTYTSVNFEKIENPFLGRIAIEYNF